MELLAQTGQWTPLIVNVSGLPCMLFCLSYSRNHFAEINVILICRTEECSGYIYTRHVIGKEQKYSSPRLVVHRMEELIVELLVVEKVWCQQQSWSCMHFLCSGMVGFGLRRKLGTAGTERHSPPSSSSMAGGILVLSAGFVMFSTVVFLCDLEIYFLVPIRGHCGSRQDG